MYRPKDWERIKSGVQDGFAYTDDSDIVRYPDMEVYEAGADAMLEGLIKNNQLDHIEVRGGKCKVVFIPDEEKIGA